jgi:hypothetical protein
MAAMAGVAGRVTRLAQASKAASNVEHFMQDFLHPAVADRDT